MTDKLVSLARSKKSKEEEAKPYDERTAKDIPDYPWGLSISLEDEQIKALGLAECDADDMMEVVGIAMVTNASSRTVNGTKKRGVELQFQKMSVKKKGDDTSTEDALYPKG